MTKTQKVIADAGITRRQLNYILRAARNAAPNTAIRLERATGIDRSVWVFGSATARQEAWREFLETRTRSKAA